MEAKFIVAGFDCRHDDDKDATNLVSLCNVFFSSCRNYISTTVGHGYIELEGDCEIVRYTDAARLIHGRLLYVCKQIWR